MSDDENSHSDDSKARRAKKHEVCRKFTKQKTLVHKLGKISESNWFSKAKKSRVNFGWDEAACGWHPNKPSTGESKGSYTKSTLSSLSRIPERRSTVAPCSHGDNTHASVPAPPTKMTPSKQALYINYYTKTFIKHYNASYFSRDLSAATIDSINQEAHKLQQEISLLKEKQKMFLPFYLNYPTQAEKPANVCSNCTRHNYLRGKLSKKISRKQHTTSNTLPYISVTKKNCWSIASSLPYLSTLKKKSSGNLSSSGSHFKVEFTNVGTKFRRIEPNDLLPANDPREFRKKLWRLKVSSFSINQKMQSVNNKTH